MALPEQKEVAGLDFEAALAEADRLIGALEEGNVPLAEAMQIYERGTKLLARCSELLEKTEAQITELMVKGNGAVAEKPLLETAADARPRKAEGGAAINPDEIPF